MTQKIEETLKTRFGFDAFLDGQRPVIERVLAGQSAAAVFPTGAGKSLCYQLPALLLPHLTLVVSPLLALMKDQLEFLLSKKIPAAKLDSGMSPEDYQAALRAARDGSVKILMIAVERFKNERFRNQLKKVKVDLLVVDEAHCISEWGHNFRPDYLKIPTYQKQFGIPRALLLTATATPKVLEDMCRKFAIPRENAFVSGVYRKNLQLRVLPATDRQRRRALVEALKEPPAGPAIVYVTLQKTAEKVAESLGAAGIDAEPYHAGMQTEQREEIQNRFMSGRLDTVVATIAFGMGIDKRDIRKVIHYDLPKSIENYSQEIGRAGRDGAPSVCTVLSGRGGVPVLENFVYGDTPDEAGIRRVLEQARQAPGRKWEVHLHGLSQESDIRLLALKTLMVYLEMKAVLSPRYVYFESYPFKLLKTQEEIAAAFDGERRGFIETIFAGSRTAKTWTTPDIDAVMKQSGAPRKRVLAALDYLDENGWIELAPRSAVEVFEVLRPGVDAGETARSLQALFKEKEALDVGRIHRTLALLEGAACLAQGLSAYFGETLPAPCGQCSFCRSGKPARLPGEPRDPLGGIAFAPLLEELSGALGPPLPVELVTRFLCGISTPRLIQGKATRLKAFGRLHAYPYREVAAWVAGQLAASGPASSS